MSPHTLPTRPTFGAVRAMAAAADGRSVGRLPPNETALLVCDVQERFRPVISGFPAVVDTSWAAHAEVELAVLLQRLQGLLRDSAKPDSAGLDGLLEELAWLFSSLSGSKGADEAFRAIDNAQGKLQVRA